MLRYPAVFTPAEEGGYVVEFPDIPEAITQGDTLEEAREMAADALATALEFYFDDNRAVPMPSESGPGHEIIEVPARLAAKILTTDNRPLQTEADYKQALAAVSALVDADPAPGTPDGCRLEMLAMLVERYEAEHFAMDLPDQAAPSSSTH